MYQTSKTKKYIIQRNTTKERVFGDSGSYRYCREHNNIFPLWCRFVVCAQRCQLLLVVKGDFLYQTTETVNSLIIRMRLQPRTHTINKFWNFFTLYTAKFDTCTIYTGIKLSPELPSTLPLLPRRTEETLSRFPAKVPPLELFTPSDWRPNSSGIPWSMSRKVSFVSPSSWTMLTMGMKWQKAGSWRKKASRAAS